jgi:L-asparaginase/Glu-tRNA(Gln) amidotransferase subunit D
MLKNERNYFICIFCIFIFSIIFLLLDRKKTRNLVGIKPLIITIGPEKRCRGEQDEILISKISHGEILWNEIAGIIFEKYLDYDAFIVLYPRGEKMVYSACAVSFMLENLSKMVIFSSDYSSAIIACKNFSIPEVVIADGENIHRATRAKYMGDIFISVRFPLLVQNGIPDSDAIFKLPIEPLKFSPFSVTKKIAVVKMYPDINQNMIKAYSNNSHGIILEGDDGDIPELNIPVIFTKNMTLESAYTKMCMLLTYVDPEIIPQIAQKNLRGEL